MRKISILIVAACIAVTANAKIWRVNNIAGITANFTTIQAAHDGAAAGDTIHLEPSNTSYGNLTMTKKLSIVSTGQFVPENPGFQQDIKMGFVDNVTVSDPAANGSLFSIRYNGSFVIANGTVANISLQNCASIRSNTCSFSTNQNENSGVLSIQDADNINVSGGWFAAVNIFGNSQNIMINNNIIGGRIQVSGSSSATIRNNVIAAISASKCASLEADISLVNSLVVNNIFNKGANYDGGSTGTTFQNNFSGNGFLPAGNGNVNNVDMSTVFVNAEGGFVDNVYQLKAGSLAIAAGLNGENLGAFGGTNPFRLAVTPAIPSIYKLVVPTTPSGSSMNIVFSTRSNN